MNSSIEIVMRKIGELKPYENNPRHNDMAVDAVAASIQQFGFKNPVIIDKDGVIVAGHTRYKAAKKLGITDIPCISADDLSDEQIKAFRLADNKTAELAEWDEDLLGKEMQGIINIDMSQFGFSVGEDELGEEMQDDGSDGGNVGAGGEWKCKCCKVPKRYRRAEPNATATRKRICIPEETGQRGKESRRGWRHDRWNASRNIPARKGGRGR